MELIKTDKVLDTKGLACPMPVVKTKRAMNDLNEGQVLEVQATDKGSKADLKAWSQNSGHQYIGLLEEDGVLKHFIRKIGNEEATEQRHPHVTTNEELERVLKEGDCNFIVLDVRESAEYAFNHIPNAISIPLGELEERFNELDYEKAIYVLCRTGNRSDYASQMLTKKGFKNVMNVMPGMNQWSGSTSGINQ
jgi:rhodanese-related sulfurtransferase/TusA-related sulfurtransferase